MPPKLRARACGICSLLVKAPSQGSTISPYLIILRGMSASEFTTLDRILMQHEDELIEEALAELPQFVLERSPRVIFENMGMPIGRWLMFDTRRLSSGWSFVPCPPTC